MEYKKSLVVAVPCDDYEPEKVYEAVRAGINALGGLSAFLRPEERVLVKPNLLKPKTKLVIPAVKKVPVSSK